MLVYCSSPQTNPVLIIRQSVQVNPVEIKIATIKLIVPTISGGQATTTTEMQQPAEYVAGLTAMTLTALAQSRRFLGVEPGVTPPLPLQLRIAVTEISLAKGASEGGGSFGSVTFGSKESEALIGLDLRIVDQSGTTVVATQMRRSVKSKTSLVQQGKLTWSQARATSLGEAARKALDDGILDLEKRLVETPWEALLLALGEEEGQVALYINSGAQNGLKVDDVLEVRRPGVLLQDPTSGRVLGRAPGKRVGLARVSALEKETATLIPTTSASFAIGDVVRFVSRPTKPKQN